MKGEIDARKIMADVTLNVTIKRFTEVRVRMWLMVKLLLLAAWVGGVNIAIDSDLEDDFYVFRHRKGSRYDGWSIGR